MNLDTMHASETFGEFSARSLREKIERLVRSAIAEEREACAKIADDIGAEVNRSLLRGVYAPAYEAARLIAARIRERNNQ